MKTERQSTVTFRSLYSNAIHQLLVHVDLVVQLPIQNKLLCARVNSCKVSPIMRAHVM